MHSTLTLNVVVKDNKYGNLFLQLVLFMMTNYKLIKHLISNELYLISGQNTYYYTAVSGYIFNKNPKKVGVRLLLAECLDQSFHCK